MLRQPLLNASSVSIAWPAIRLLACKLVALLHFAVVYGCKSGTVGRDQHDTTLDRTRVRGVIGRRGGWLSSRPLGLTVGKELSSSQLKLLSLGGCRGTDLAEQISRELPS